MCAPCSMRDFQAIHNIPLQESKDNIFTINQADETEEELKDSLWERLWYGR